MSRSFVVGKRSSRVVFGRFCADAVINELTTIVIERKKKRQDMFIEQQERSDQSDVERLGCNSDFTIRLDAAAWRIRFRRGPGTGGATCNSQKQPRKGWDSNPRWVSPRSISSRVP